MDRRRFLMGLGLGTAAAAFPTVALAAHVNEPTAKIIDLRLALSEYATQTKLRGDGTDKVAFDKLRIEGTVRPEARPSEHWNSTLRVWRLIDASGSKRVLGWDTFWPHQNVPPHTPQGYYNFCQSNEWHLGEHIGWWEIELFIEAPISGTLRTAIKFERVAS
jgi:hypothetical protein